MQEANRLAGMDRSQVMGGSLFTLASMANCSVLCVLLWFKPPLDEVNESAISAAT